MPFPLHIWIPALCVRLSSSSSSPSYTKLRVGLYPETLLPWARRDSATGEYHSGFMVDFYKELAFVGNFDIEFIPITEAEYATNFTGVTQRLLQAGTIDMGWDSNSTMAPGFLYSSSFFTSEQTILTKKVQDRPGMWQVFAPFREDVWVCIIVEIVAGATVLALLTRIFAAQGCADCMRSFPRFFYHTFAALVGGDEYDLYHAPPLGRLYRLGLLFSVMVLTATYTANLAAFLTKPQYKLLGPQSFDELSSATACVRWPGWTDDYVQYFGRLLLPPAGMIPPASYMWARESLQRGDCDLIVDAKPNLKPESLELCESVHFNPDMVFMPAHLYNVLLDNNTELAQRVTAATNRVKGLPAYAEMVDRNMRYAATCPSVPVGNETTQITALQLAPSFFLFVVCSLTAIAITALQRVLNGGRPLAHARQDVQNEKLDGKIDILISELNALRSTVEPKTELV